MCQMCAAAVQERGRGLHHAPGAVLSQGGKKKMSLGKRISPDRHLVAVHVAGQRTVSAVANGLKEGSANSRGEDLHYAVAGNLVDQGAEDENCCSGVGRKEDLLNGLVDVDQGVHLEGLHERVVLCETAQPRPSSTSLGCSFCHLQDLIELPKPQDSVRGSPVVPCKRWHGQNDCKAFPALALAVVSDQDQVAWLDVHGN